MKQHNTFIIFRNKEHRGYLSAYENIGTSLSCSGSWVDDDNVERAFKLDERYFEADREMFDHLLPILNVEPIKVKAEYTLTTLVKEESEVELEDKRHDELVRLNEAIERFIEAITGENE